MNECPGIEMINGVVSQIQVLKDTQSLECIVINGSNLIVVKVQFLALGQVTKDSRREMSDRIDT